MVELGVAIALGHRIFLFRDDYRRCTDCEDYPLNLMLFAGCPNRAGRTTSIPTSTRSGRPTRHSFAGSTANWTERSRATPVSHRVATPGRPVALSPPTSARSPAVSECTRSSRDLIPNAVPSIPLDGTSHSDHATVDSAPARAAFASRLRPVQGPLGVSVRLLATGEHEIERGLELYAPAGARRHRTVRRIACVLAGPPRAPCARTRRAPAPPRSPRGAASSRGAGSRCARSPDPPSARRR